jgi:hypothetical protein
MIKDFAYIGSCNCDGVRNLKYEKNGYIVYLRPKKKVYHIKFNNNYLVKYQPYSTLCQKLKSLGLTDSDECLEIS